MPNRRDWTTAQECIPGGVRVTLYSAHKQTSDGNTIKRAQAISYVDAATGVEALVALFPEIEKLEATV